MTTINKHTRDLLDKLSDRTKPPDPQAILRGKITIALMMRLLPGDETTGTIDLSFDEIEQAERVINGQFDHQARVLHLFLEEDKDRL